MATSIFRTNFPTAEKLQQTADKADYIIGLDLHAKTTAVCVIDTLNPVAPVFQRKRLKNIDLIDKLKSFKGKKLIACESAYGWFPLREALAEIDDITLAVLDPRKTSAWISASGIKNDKIDAQVLCYACLHGGLRSLAVYQPDHQSRENFRLVTHRESLVRYRTKLTNQLNFLEREYGPNQYTGEITAVSPLIKDLKDDLLESLNQTEKLIKNTENKMAEIGKDDRIIKLLQSIPGIGFLTAFALRFKIETLERFKDSAHLASYFGFGIRQRQSGDNLVKGRITKTGNSVIRKLLVQGAQIIRFKHPEYLPLYFPNLGQPSLMKDTKHANKTVIALARKNLTFVFHIWKKDEVFDIDFYRQRRQHASIKVKHASSLVSSEVAELGSEPVLLGRNRA
jgi:transposase